MKKTLLATAIAGALGVTAAAQAATVYDQDGTQVDVYGRINFAVTTGGEDGTYSAFGVDADGNLVRESVAVKQSGSEFRDVFSRFGFRARHQLSSDLSVFANMEFRPRLDAQNDDSMTVRNSFVGISSNQFGTLRAGNFDGMVYQAITGKYEIHELHGYTTLSGGDAGSRGDSLAYSTPNLEGFQAHLQAKHLSGNNRTATTDTSIPVVDVDSREVVDVVTVGQRSNSAIAGAQDNSSTLTWQGAVTYQIDALHLGLGYNQVKDVADRGARYDGGSTAAAGEDVWVGSAIYNFTPEFTAGVKYEQVTDKFEDVDAAEKLWTVMAEYDYGMGEVYADYNRLSYSGETSSRNLWTLGATYRFSQPMYVWAEIHDGDFDSDQRLRDINDDLYYSVGLRYDF